MRAPRLLAAFVLTALVAVIELWGGLRAHSLALLGDAIHVFTDALALGIALGALYVAARPANVRKTYGYGRLEILAAVFNGALLLVATGVVAYEAVLRFFVPQLPQAASMSIVGAIAFVLNVAIALALRHDAQHNLNVRTAFLHVLGDAAGAAAVIVAGIVIGRTGATWLDPALGLVIAALVVLGVVQVLLEAADVLLEAVPRGVEVSEVEGVMRAVEGVTGVHDLHVWTIGSRGRALSAHVLLSDRRVSEVTAVLRELEARLRERFGIRHVTVQFESETCWPDDRIVCTQLH